jgi:hypothetical protein
MRPPSFRTASILLVLLSLSIGWGIRGNYGHEAGAMMPGALAGIAAALVSGREDWRRRVPFFAFFGALGWAFGGSIAYMVPPSYTFSGHLPTQVYGFFATFLEAFLWAGIGGVATAYAAVEARDRLTALFRPILWVLSLWAVQYLVQDAPLGIEARIFRAFGADRSDFRQRDPLYWLDSDWLESVLALIALCAFDLWERRFARSGHLVLCAGVGALAGWGLERLLVATGLEGPLLHAVVQPQGDLSRFPAEDLVTNWPILFHLLGHNLGWILGGVAGVVFHFRRHGVWRDGSPLLVRMAVWSLAVFLIGPVLLSNLPLFQAVGGFRLAPPRGDCWANTLGVFIGIVLHFRRTGQKPLVFAAMAAGVLGGVALTSAQFIKLLLVSPGNPVLTDNAAAIEFWRHWRSANWHSVALEQFAGFLYGLAVVVPVGMLASRLPVRESEPRTRPWTESFSVAFVLCAVGYINLVKNVKDWTEPHRVGEGIFRAVAEVLRAPLIGNIQISAWGWFTVGWILFSGTVVWVLTRHRREPVAVVPTSWLGKGQLLYLVFLWMIVIANFAKALTGFHESRLATEGIITFNAFVATVLILCFIPARDRAPALVMPDYERLTRKSVLCLGISLAVAMVLFTAGIRALYGDKFVGWGGNNVRFGENADWRVKPILKSARHR